MSSSRRRTYFGCGIALMLLLSGSIAAAQDVVQSFAATQTTNPVQAFATLDRDGDRLLELAEFSAHFNAADAARAKRDFLLFDLDRDERLNAIEFRTVPSIVSAERRGAIPDPIEAVVEKFVAVLDAHFVEWQTDKTAKVSVLEFNKQLSLALGMPQELKLQPTGLTSGWTVNRSMARLRLEMLLGVCRFDGQLLRLPNGRVVNEQLFRHINRGGNGPLHRDEFWTRSIPSELSRKAFESGDTNRDSSLAFDEWAKLPGLGWVDPIEDFLKLDQNFDGRVDPAELKAGTPAKQQSLTTNVFPGFDTDRDGVLSLDEYRLTMLALPVVPWPRAGQIRDPAGAARLGFRDFASTDTARNHGLLCWWCFQRLDLNSNAVLETDEFEFRLWQRDELFSLNADGSGWKSLMQLEPRGRIGSPCVSPDGKLIAFDFCPAIGHQFGVMLVGSDGQQPRELCAGERPSWSPDGRFLTCSREGKFQGRWINGLWRVQIDNQSDQLLCPIYHRGGSWSPDGRKIAFQSGVREVSCFDLEGELANVIVPAIDKQGWVESDFAWSPDGTQICFGRGGRDAVSELVIVNSLGAELGFKVRAAFPGASGSSFAWHPQGDRIVFSVLCPERELPQLYELNPQTDEAPKLVLGQDPTRRNKDASWTPDGKQLIVTSGEY